MAIEHHVTTPRPGMPDALRESLDRLAATYAGWLRSATDILAFPTYQPLPRWDRPWWNRE